MRVWARTRVPVRQCASASDLPARAPIRKVRKLLSAANAYLILHSSSVLTHHFLSFRTLCHFSLVRKRQDSLLQPIIHPSQISSPDKPVYKTRGHAMVHHDRVSVCDQPYWRQAAGSDPPMAQAVVLEQVRSPRKASTYTNLFIFTPQAGIPSALYPLPVS
jgi:hypothetical protein